MLKRKKAVLAIPEVCVDQIIALYHSSLFAGHQGVLKTYLTMSDKFFIPDLMHYLRSYIKGCHICQFSNKDKIPNRHFQRRINLNYNPLSRLSMDLKVMPKSYRGHKFILCVIDEMINYLITMPIYQVLCNPKFICKNNRHFSLSSRYFLYPIASLPKMVKQEMPASIEQS